MGSIATSSRRSGFSNFRRSNTGGNVVSSAGLGLCTFQWTSSGDDGVQDPFQVDNKILEEQFVGKRSNSATCEGGLTDVCYECPVIRFGEVVVCLCVGQLILQPVLSVESLRGLWVWMTERTFGVTGEFVHNESRSYGPDVISPVSQEGGCAMCAPIVVGGVSVVGDGIQFVVSKLTKSQFLIMRIANPSMLVTHPGPESRRVSFWIISIMGSLP